MRAWALFLGGLLVWAGQFFLLYAIGSIFLTTLTARLLVAAVTLAALAADIWLLLWARARLRGTRDGLQRWMAGMAMAMAAVSLIAVAWQGLPALLA